MDLEADKTSVAALMSVILRRKLNRTVDVKWLVKNHEYAREVLRISRELDMPDLNRYADHLEELMFGHGSDTHKAKETGDDLPVAESSRSTGTEEAQLSNDTKRYIGHLR